MYYLMRSTVVSKSVLFQKRAMHTDAELDEAIRKRFAVLLNKDPTTNDVSGLRQQCEQGKLANMAERTERGDKTERTETGDKTATGDKAATASKSLSTRKVCMFVSMGILIASIYILSSNCHIKCPFPRRMGLQKKINRTYYASDDDEQTCSNADDEKEIYIPPDPKFQLL